MPGSTQCEIRTRGISQINELVRAHTSYTTNVDTLCREVLINLARGEEIFLSSTYPLSSDGNLQTAFASFSVDETMNPIIAFHVARSNSETKSGRFTFDTILVDTNNRWNTETNDYTIQVAGIYVLSIMTGAYSGYGHVAYLKQNSQEVSTIKFSTSSQDATDLITKTILCFSNANDKFSLELYTGYVYSDLRHFISFSGFMYSPISSPVAWYVATSSGAQTGPVDPFIFEEVIININNVGGGWYLDTNTYIVPLSGVYYINLCSGSSPYTMVNLLLLLNDDPVNNIQIMAQNRNGYDVRGKSIIMRLEEGDELRVMLPSGYAAYSDSRTTTFSGFRLHS